mmetsp:Transcript_35680/g.106486  ORF Transcript_35680/g.106486 Transcript_35680/m.106486 type:complete len:104 (+) Transcript_35680:64-375(+)
MVLLHASDHTHQEVGQRSTTRRRLTQLCHYIIFSATLSRLTRLQIQVLSTSFTPKERFFLDSILSLKPNDAAGSNSLKSERICLAVSDSFLTRNEESHQPKVA